MSKERVCMELKIDKKFIDEAVQEAVKDIKQNYIPKDTLDKIRAEIEALKYLNIEDGSGGYDKYIEQYEVLKIIDKYNVESEEEE